MVENLEGKVQGGRRTMLPTVALLGAAMSCGPMSCSCTCETGKKPGVTVFSDDFSKPHGWVSTSPENLHRDAASGKYVLNVARDETRLALQYLENPVENLTLQFDIAFDSYTNNCNLDVGLASRLGADMVPRPAVWARTSWFGGGCSNTGYLVSLMAVSREGKVVGTYDGHECGGSFGTGYVPTTKADKYTVTLTRDGDVASLTVAKDGETVKPVGKVTLDLPTLGTMPYVYMGGIGDDDHPKCAGTVDNVKLTTRK